MSSYDFTIHNPYIFYEDSRKRYHSLEFGTFSGIRGVCSYWCNTWCGATKLDTNVDFEMLPDKAELLIDKYITHMELQNAMSHESKEYYFFDPMQTPRDEWNAHLQIFLLPWRYALVAARTQRTPIHIKIEW